MSAHTAMPLTQGDESATEIYDATGNLVADIKGYGTTPEQDANFAALIVRACNAHDGLVAALSTLLDQVDKACSTALPATAFKGARDGARAALAALAAAGAA